MTKLVYKPQNTRKPWVVAKYLGHASSRVTEGVYGHVVPVRLGEHAQLLR